MGKSVTADPAAGKTAPQPTAIRQPPRVWPALVIVALFWIFRFGVRGRLPETLIKPTSMAVTLGKRRSRCLAWWLFFSRLRRTDRLAGVAALAVGGTVAIPLIDGSLRLVQRDGVAMLATPLVITAIVGWLVVSRWLSPHLRAAGLIVVALATWASFLTVRIDHRGGWGDMKPRWSPTAEQKLLAQRSTADKTGTTAAGSLVVGPGDWPQFRGPDRDNHVTGVRIDTDWEQHPPKLIWKQPIGPGWSSFSVVGGFCFTQEQHGEQEATVCYRLDTGAEVWAHSDTARFEDPATGAGPRGVPTFDHEKLYTVGATGIVDCLDASSGQLLWQREILKDAQTKLQEWGIATSPLVAGELVIVFAGGGAGKGTIAYSTTTGEPVWMSGRGTHSFSSPQISRLDGVEQILMAHDLGLDAFDPATGKVLWQYDWTMDGNGRMVQPCVLGDDRVILASGYNQGARLLKVAHADAAWQVEDLWDSKKLVPYYNDFIVYQNYIYGFDGNIFCCVDAETGERKWKKGRYGYGQVLLLVDQGVLLVITDEGEAVLVAAEPDGLRELGKQQVLEGKSGNHPVLVYGNLLVRNAQEAACYQLTTEPETTTAAK